MYKENILVCTLLLAKSLANLPQDLIKTGQAQYQLLEERSSLPQYGSCWKQAIQNVHAGCSSLSEETQSVIALHLTNCFLEMSGHESYHCESDRKPNLRKICISNMSDRVFSVYTEFYTHTQNICWFLQGQVWQEIIAESTYQVGKQLEMSAQNQEELLNVQKESLAVQERLLKHGHDLERIVENIVGGIAYSQQTLLGIQNWLISEMAWFDTVLFYIISLVFVFIFTSLRSTTSCRLPLLMLLFVGMLSERFICKLFIAFNTGEKSDGSHMLLMKFIWFLRYTLVALCVITVVFSICNYKDYEKINNGLLQDIRRQHFELIEMLQNRSKPESLSQNISVWHEKTPKQKQNCLKSSENGVGVKKYYLRSEQRTLDKI